MRCNDKQIRKGVVRVKILNEDYKVIEMRKLRVTITKILC